MPSPSAVRPALLALILAAGLVAPAQAQDDPVAWSTQAARGAFDLCRSDAPDADKVAEHGEVWGWPHFSGYLQHPKGYEREAGGESRRDFAAGTRTAFVELGVQSGHVTSVEPAQVHYFRCDLAADQSIDGDLEAYFTGLYGPPISKTDEATVWLKAEGGASVTADDAASDDTAVKTVTSAAVGARVTRVELSHQLGLDRAKLTIFDNGAAS
jgi:hypothetical protein